MKPGTQHGATLVIALVFLIMLTLLALAGSQVSLQQERMAGNFRESNEAFQSAEATVRELEQCLLGIYAQGFSGFCDTRRLTWTELENALVLTEPLTDCTLESVAGDNLQNLPWNDNASNPYIVVSLNSSTDPATNIPRGSACKPVEEEEQATYLIVARAPGPAGVGTALVQSIFYWTP